MKINFKVTRKNEWEKTVIHRSQDKKSYLSLKKIKFKTETLKENKFMGILLFKMLKICPSLACKCVHSQLITPFL